LRVGIFRALWIANLVGNIGTWMQTVGAQWLLVHHPHAPVLVALVQTADMAPDVLLAYIGGVLADTFDRRQVLIAVQVYLIVAGLALTILTVTGQMPPALLLTLTFLIGAGSAFSTPAYQALIPDLVPRAELRSASALGSINVNLARAVGPALAGMIIAKAGVGAVFALNTATFLVFAIVVVTSRPPARKSSGMPEQFVSAVQAGGRYIVHAPVVRRLLSRSALFLVPASALWALLPLIATRQLGLGPSGYGLLLGAIGAGAVAGALALPNLQVKLSNNALLFSASVVYAVVLVVLISVHEVVVSLSVLVAAGIAWIAVLSSTNAALQIFLPAWVRARGLSVYQMVLFGAQAVGAAVWGAVAATAGLPVTFLIATAIMIAGAATIRFRPLHDTSGFDRSTAAYWPEPHLVVEPDPQVGPVLVMNTYAVSPENEAQFLDAMTRVEQSRLRTGAVEWGLYRTGETAHRFVEIFSVPTWEEHLRQHNERLTGTDRQYEEDVEALSESSPQVMHLLGVDLPE
jgi:MFS family permease